MQIEIDPQKLIEESIKEGIENSEEFHSQIEKVLETDECRELIRQNTKEAIKKYLQTEDGKKAICNVIKKYVDEYDVSYDDDVSGAFSDIIINLMKSFFDISKLKKGR